MRTATTVVAVTAAALLATGCYGTYQATNKLNAWNGTVSSNKVARSLVHFGLWVIPVYELAIVGDFLIFNNVEFLTGTNPLK
jgi:hypothetical protein